ncbi:amino acid adenylation domain-containing protein, partial [Streptomyces sp. NPDC127033]|uniref:amino acid adenylation domain-containing protein n=1 Tax=Streptomyces sp. NPDC127033 TaxID=3347110 RepID=UPI00364FB8CC
MHPDSTAVVCGDRELTYQSLDKQSELLSKRLAALGIHDESIVGIALPRSEWCAVAWLGVAKVNGVCLWLDPDYPGERLSAMIDDAAPRLIVTTRETYGQLSEVAASSRLVVIDDQPDPEPAPELVAPPRADPRPAAAESASYVIYTSGSTGRPKGVVLTSTGVLSLVDTLTERFGADADSRVLQFTAMSFDVAFLEMCMSLLVGGRLVVVPAERRVADETFLRYLTRQGITHAALPPAFLELLPDEGALPPGLTIMTGADKVPMSMVRRWSRRARLVACYGLTEATVNSTVWPCDPQWPGPVAPIGVADPGTAVHLLDDRLRPVAPGEPGEMYIAGDGLARGYLHRPALTAERFVPDPLGAPGSRMYRTGDRAVRNEDGVLEFLGRVDAQVKIRGHRIEPTEVEAALLSHPAVAQAVVTAQEQASTEAQLAAYVVAGEGDAVDVRELRRHVARLLPRYMVPSIIVPVAAIPLLPSGKLDRGSLPSLPPRAASGPPSAVGGSEEDMLRRLLAEALGEEVPEEFDFVALGGHSLLAMRLAAAVRAGSGCTIGVGDVFAARTVTQLAARLVPVAAPGLRSGVRGPAPVPLSYEQERLWLLETMSGSGVGTVYHVPWTWRVRGVLDTGALRRALEDLTARHEILRTRFPLRDGSPVQEILDAGRAPLDFAVVGTEEERLADEVSAAAAETFDLEAEPPVRVRVFTVDAEDSVVLLCMHHLIVDDWSVALLAEELTTAYTTRLSDRTPENTAPDLHFADYSAWQRGARERMGDDLAFWRNQLDGLPVETTLPMDRERPAVPTAHGETFTRHWT